ncbi:ubiquitin-like protein ISG15 [Xiphias gladius]|uniref:ubiquitin-like protein ISG15 n=1 Tax=Xiphias gladius TaxID=8245 RepID=UPI001A9A1639|nr:ubiquitin-like protein ISG15 [Xiphias gladius]
MDIIVTMLNGTSHTLSVQPKDTVGSLKTVIHEKLGVPPRRQRLVFVNGQRTDLSDDLQSVEDCGLESGSRLSLLVTEPSPPATIEVSLLNERGQRSTYDISPDETVGDFKRRVESREGVAVSQQRLVFQGRQMDAGKLSDYNVKALSTINLCLRLRGG